MSLANISIVGNLAKEPEQFQFASGRTKTTLFVAVSSFNKVRKEKTTDYYRVETWDRLAELANEYLKKGNQVAVSGRIAMEKWVDREGKDRVTPTVQANQLALPPRYRPDFDSKGDVDLAPNVEPPPQVAGDQVMVSGEDDNNPPAANTDEGDDEPLSASLSADDNSQIMLSKMTA